MFFLICVYVAGVGVGWGRCVWEVFLLDNVSNCIEFPKSSINFLNNLVYFKIYQSKRNKLYSRDTICIQNGGFVSQLNK